MSNKQRTVHSNSSKKGIARPRVGRTVREWERAIRNMLRSLARKCVHVKKFKVGKTKLTVW